MLVIFVAGGLAGIALAAAADPGSAAPLIGPAGAIAAVIAARLVLAPQSKVVTVVLVPFFFNVVEAPAALIGAVWVGAALALQASGLSTPLGEGGAAYELLGGAAFGLLAAARADARAARGRFARRRRSRPAPASQATTTASLCGSKAIEGAEFAPPAAICTGFSNATPPGPPGTERAARSDCCVSSQPATPRGACASTIAASLRGPAAIAARRRSAPGSRHDVGRKDVAARQPRRLDHVDAVREQRPRGEDALRGRHPHERERPRAEAQARRLGEGGDDAGAAAEGHVGGRVHEVDRRLPGDAPRGLRRPGHERAAVVAQDGGDLR